MRYVNWKIYGKGRQSAGYHGLGLRERREMPFDAFKISIQETTNLGKWIVVMFAVL